MPLMEDRVAGGRVWAHIHGAIGAEDTATGIERPCSLIHEWLAPSEVATHVARETST